MGTGERKENQKNNTVISCSAVFPSTVFSAAMAQSWDPLSASIQPRCPMFAHVGQPAITGKMAMPGILFPVQFCLLEHAKIGVGVTRAISGSEGGKTKETDTKPEGNSG